MLTLGLLGLLGSRIAHTAPSAVLCLELTEYELFRLFRPNACLTLGDAPARRIGPCVCPRRMSGSSSLTVQVEVHAGAAERARGVLVLWVLVCESADGGCRQGALRAVAREAVTWQLRDNTRARPVLISVIKNVFRCNVGQWSCDFG